MMSLKHFKLHGTPATYCAHPRQGGIWNFGGGEIAVIHRHAGCCYQTEQDAGHSPPGAHARAHYLLQRSMDAGKTWPGDLEVAVFDEAVPEPFRCARLFDEGKRQEIDLSDPNAIVMFGTSWPGWVCFAIRSGDRGKTWEYKPTIVQPPAGLDRCHKDNHPLICLGDDRLVGAVQCGPDPPGPWLYETTDNGLTWRPLTQIVGDTGSGPPTYAGLLKLPDGRLSCYTYVKADMKSYLQVNTSDDEGQSWDHPRQIVSEAGKATWATASSAGAMNSTSQPEGATPYRSPWPLLLRDGRIVVIFARRAQPYGIGAILSEDLGETWSDEMVIRSDGSCPDLGYPVATELADGKIFTAYYFCIEDGNRFGGSRFIGASCIELG